ncbi:hypothetical protein [Fibrella forsythiae]|uniref:Lipoprotein n=1 Tax=Fibrella forsythiae TaxID=2817061 RepID=A0ABS3JD05_9BACT|nr:hypothetical protein [Fibrella forsythiae]MBO0947884.1 hypothetical protein [Fibrella forsythiae]
MKPYLLPLFVAVGVVVLSCSSGKTAYRRGDFAEAVQKASQRLSQKPGISRRGHALAKQVIQRAFVDGYEQHQSTIRSLVAQAGKPFRWEAVFTEYSVLQQMTTDARQAAPGSDWLATYPADYSQRLDESRGLAAEERYALAESAYVYRESNRQAARDAYEQYQKALAWVPGYRQAAQKSLESFPYAVLRVLIEPPVLTPELDPSETAELGRDIFSSLQGDNHPSPYVHLLDPNQVDVGIDGAFRLYDGFPVNEAVQVAVSDYRPYDSHFTTTSTTVESNQLYKVGTKRINDSTVVDVMEKVKGTLTLHTHLVEARMDVDLRAIDTKTGRVIWTDSDQSTADWKIQWETFSGDDRALNGHTLLTATGTPPSRQSLLSSLSSNMGSSIVGTLRRRYKKL